MTDEQWRTAMLKLLSYFDEMEGSTYLYEKGEREYFLKSLDPSIRPQMTSILNEYHQPASDGKRA